MFRTGALMACIFWTQFWMSLQTAGDATVEFIALDTDVLADDPDQLDWINQTLRESTADWIIPFGHHPVYSTGKHGRWCVYHRHLYGIDFAMARCLLLQSVLFGSLVQLTHWVVSFSLLHTGFV